jgi:pimeloyl-ACP methyl ester carboxylesterase
LTNFLHKSTSANSHFRSSTGERIIRSQYDDLLTRWPVPYDSLLIETSFGNTHIIASGDPAAPPLILLHGRSTNATMWVLDVAHYSAKHRVYALDILGEPGRSAPTRLKGYQPSYAQWLLEVCEQLAIGQVTLLGISFGAWLSLKFAAFAADRVRSLILLSPAGFTLPQPKTIARVLLTLLPGKPGIEPFLRSLAVQPLTDEALALMAPILAYYNSNPEPPLPFSDSQLRKVTMPTLLLIGAQDNLFSAQSTVARAELLLPNLCAKIIPGAGHMLPYDQPDIVRDHVMHFLDQN